MSKSKKIIVENPTKLNLTFEQAMKKALSTPIPKKKAENQQKKNVDKLNE